MLKYHQLRRHTIAHTHAELQNIIDANDARRIKLTEITTEALKAEQAWKANTHLAKSRAIGWDWYEALKVYRRNHAARMELAIWLDENLCGLMLGKPSTSKMVMKLNYIQGAPYEHSLKGYVVPIAILYAELYASALAVRWLGIQDPLEEPALIDYYHRLGFTRPDPFDPRNNALFKAL